MILNQEIKTLIRLALEEDIRTGDITSTATVAETMKGRGFVKAKSKGIFCGRDVFTEVFGQIDPNIRCEWNVRDGESLDAGQKCLLFEGSLRSILIAERTALNFIQRLSGIATLTNEFVNQIRHTSAKIIDTRKTTPLWRELEKYAVVTGGGSNHRMGLYDMFLIKDNHITAAGGIGSAIRSAIAYKEHSQNRCAIEIETKNLAEVKEALQFPIQRIMLDNMSVADIREAVQMIRHRCEVEASGGVHLSNVREIAETGVDFISVGSLTHSAPAMDLSLLIETI
ncbi:carboxylating nicotinate-nucleotide diphosphorylase [bacterium]|nr:carboxylating nicotinate-nucleotide diphosphorylase [bacterium]